MQIEQLIREKFSIDKEDIVRFKEVAPAKYRVNTLRKITVEGSTLYKFTNIGSYYVEIKDNKLTDLTIKK